MFWNPIPCRKAIANIYIYMHYHTRMMHGLYTCINTGQSASSLPSTQLQVSLTSSQTYVAAINVSESSFYGVWQLSFTSHNSYRVYITGDSNLLFGYNLYRSDNTTRSGLSEVKTKVLPGQSIQNKKFNFMCT